MHFHPARGSVRVPFPFRAHIAAILAAISGLSTPSWAELPSQATVVHGNVSIATSGRGMTVNQSSTHGIVNWNSFSVGAGHSVHFNNGAGATLNRVTGITPSRIDGSLSATGSLYLLNRNGIILGRDGSVLTGGSFVASTRDMADADFLNGGGFTLFGNSTAGITNLGKISSSGGNVLLAGYTVSNSGTLEAPTGRVGLAAGGRIDVLTDASWLSGAYAVSLGERGNDITNEGRILATVAELRTHNGNIYALAGNNTGLIHATGVNQEGGRVVLTAAGGTVQSSGTVRATQTDAAGQVNGGRIEITAAAVENFGGVQDVSGATGGSIHIQADSVTTDTEMRARGTQGAGGAITLEATREILFTSAGLIDASGGSAGGQVSLLSGPGFNLASGVIKATASEGLGGTVALLGQRVSLLGATVDASGATGGGSIFVGGGYQGVSVQGAANALSTYISDRSVLRADATGAKGDGGTVVAWADGTTQFAGTITARGGSQSGHGGVAETSGLAGLGVSGTVDASARGQGSKGSWLLDPKNITIGTITDSMSEFQKITQSFGAQPSETSSTVNFGQYIDVNGETLVVGAPTLNTAFVFESGLLAARLTAPSGADFGEGVGVVGNTVAVFSGAENYFDGANKPGVTHVYAKGTGWKNGTVNRALFFSNPSTFTSDYNGFGQSTGSGNNLRFSLGTMPNGSQDVLLAIGNPDYGNGGNYGAVYTAVIPGSLSPSTSPTKGTLTTFFPTSPYNSTSNFKYGNSVTANDGLVYVQSGDSNSSTLLSVINVGRGLVTDFPGVLYGGGLIAAENGLLFNVRNTQAALLGVSRNDFGGAGASLNYNSGLNINTSAFASGATSLAYSGDTLMIGRGNDGLVNVYRRPLSAGWIGSTTIQPSLSVSAPGTGLGYSLAIDDDYAALGKSSASSSRGEIATYQRAGETWTAGDTLRPAASTEQTTFGQEMAADGTTNTVVIADQAAWDQNSTQSGSRGRVYVYENGGLAATLTGIAPSAYGFAGFGDKVAVSDNRIAVTNAFSYDGNTSALLGRVQLYEKGAAWRNGTANRGWHYDFHGMIGAVALSGNTLAVGTPVPTFGQPGSVFVFPSISGSSFGSGPITLQNPDRVANVADNFGNSLALSGNTLAIGQPRAPSSGYFGTNRSFVQEDYSSTGLTDYNIYLFENSANNWAGATSTRLNGATVLNPAQDSVGWGYSLALSGDTLVTGYHRDAPLNASRGVYVFQRNGTWANSTTPVARLTGDARNFGFDVDIYNDTIAVSSPNYLQNFVYGSPTGAHSPVYLFKKYTGWANGSANLVTKLLPASNVNLEPFGIQVELTSSGLWASSMINMVGASSTMSPIYQFNSPFEASARATFGSNPSGDLNISATSLAGSLSLGTNVTLQANNDITISSAINVNNPNGDGGDLTLLAGRRILVNASITTDNGDLTMVANAPGANATYRDAGERVVVLGRDSNNAPVTLNMGTGDLVIAAADRFENRTGATNPFRFAAIDPGRWLVYATTPNQSGAPDAGNLQADLATAGRDWVHYGRAFNFSDLSPATLPAGDGFIYTVQPTVGVSVGNASITYGQAFSSASLGLGSLTLGGSAISGSVFGIGATDLPQLVNVGLSASVSVGSNGFVNAGTYTGGITATGKASVTSGAVYGVAISTTGAGNLTVGKKALDVRPADATRIYRDANPSFTANYTGFVSGDSASVLDAPPTLSTLAALSSNVGTFAINATGGTDNNYTFNVTGTGQLTINQRDLALTGLTGVSRTYDTTTAAAFTGTASIAPLGGDNVTVAGTLNATAAFANANVGINKPLSLSGFSLAGAQAGNYRLVLPTNLTASITPATLNLEGLLALDRDYNRSNVASLSGTATVVPLGSDVVSVIGTPSAAFANANAGVSKPVTVSGLSLSGAAAGNYVLSTSGLTATIRPLALDLTGLSALDRVYDATDVAVLTGAPSVTPLAGDTVNVTGAATGLFADKNVGIDKAVTVNTGGLTLTGAAAGNYVLRAPTGLVADVTPALLDVTGVSTADRVYDATTVATLTGTATVVPLGSDVVNVTAAGATAAFADKNVGTGKAVSVTGYTLSGADAANYLVVQPTGLTADITPRPLTVTGLVVNHKVYDATTVATASGTAAFGGILPGDDTLIEATSFSFAFADKNAGLAKPVALTGISLSGTDAANYDATRATGFTADITPATLTVDGATALDRQYDATTTVVVTAGTLSGVLAGDNIVFSTAAATGTLASKAVGVARPVTASGYAVSATDAGNYVLTQPTGLTASISAVELNLVGLSADKVYDSTKVAPLTAAGLDAVLAGDKVLPDFAAVTALYADKHAGVGRAVSLSGLFGLTGEDAGNYTLTQPASLTGTIAPRAITVSGLTIANKTYDGNNLGVISGTGAFGGVLSGDDLAIDVGAIDVTFVDANAGVNKAVTLSGVTLSGADAGNYTAATPAGITATIAPKDLTVTGLAAVDRVYDRTQVAALTGTGALQGVLPGESITLNESTRAGVFDSKHVGSGKSVTVTGLVLSGTGASNYRVVSPSLTASITPAEAIVTGLTALDRVYDSTINAPVSGLATLNFGALQNVLASAELVSLSGTASGVFANKNVGSDKSVTVSGLVLAGTDAGNYTLRLPSNLTADVTPADLQVTGASVANKTYDATRAATLVSRGSVAALGADSVSLNTSAATATFVDKHAGLSQAAAATGYVLEGDDAANYRLVDPAGLVAQVARAELQLTGVTADNKVYDGSLAAPLSGTLAIAPLGTDVVSVSGAPLGRFSDKNVGQGKTVTISGLALAGLDAANYTFVLPALTADVTPRAVTLGGLSAVDRVYDGSRNAALVGTASISGAVLGDSLTVDLSALVATFADKRVGLDKAVALSGNSLRGDDAGNYTQVLPTNLAADITAKEITVTGVDALDRAYDRTLVVGLQGGGLSGAVVGDAITLVTSGATGTIATKDAGVNKPVTATGYTLSGEDATNYTLRQPTGLDVVISKREVEISGLQVADKLFDGNTNATVSGGTLSNVVSGDALALVTTEGSARFENADVGNNKAVLLAGYRLSGDDAANYVLNTAPSITGRIVPELKNITDVVPAEVLRASAMDAQASRRRELEQAANQSTSLVKTFDYTQLTNQVATGLVISRPIEAILFTPFDQQDSYTKAYIAAANAATRASYEAERIVGDYRNTAIAYKETSQKINQAIRDVAVEKGLRDLRLGQIEQIKPQLAQADKNLAAAREAQQTMAEYTQKIQDAARLGRGSEVAEYQRILSAATAVAATEKDMLAKRDALAKEAASAEAALVASDAKISSLESELPALNTQLAAQKQLLDNNLAASAEAKAKAAAANEALVAAQKAGADAALADVKGLDTEAQLISLSNSDVPAKTAAKMVETDPFVLSFEQKAADAAQVTQTLGQGLAQSLTPATLTYAQSLAKKVSDGGLLDDSQAMRDALVKSVPALTGLQSKVDVIDQEQAKMSAELDAAIAAKFRFALMSEQDKAAAMVKERARLNDRINQLAGGGLDLSKVPTTNADGEVLTELERISIAMLNKQIGTPQGNANETETFAYGYRSRVDSALAEEFGFSPRQALNDPKVLAEEVGKRVPINSDGTLDKEQLAENLKVAASVYVEYASGKLKDMAIEQLASQDPTGATQAYVDAEKAARAEFVKTYGAQPEDLIKDKINDRIDAYKNADSPQALLKVHAASMLPGGEMTIETATKVFNDLKAGKSPDSVAKELASNLWNGDGNGPSARDQVSQAAETSQAAQKAIRSSLEASDKTGIYKSYNAISFAAEEEFAKTFGGSPQDIGINAIKDPKAAANSVLSVAKDVLTTPTGAANIAKGGINLASNMVSATLATAEKQIDIVASKFGGPGKAAAFVAKFGITAATEVKDFLQDAASVVTFGLIDKSGPSKTEIENAIAYAKAEEELARAREDATLMRYLMTAQSLANAKAQLATGVVNAKAQVGQYLLATQQQKKQQETATIAKQVATEALTKVVKDGITEKAQLLRAKADTPESTEQARARNALWRSQ
jgi:filamentous hemagglutinin family protein